LVDAGFCSPAANHDPVASSTPTMSVAPTARGDSERVDFDERAARGEVEARPIRTPRLALFTRPDTIFGGAHTRTGHTRGEDSRKNTQAGLGSALFNSEHRRAQK